MREAFVAGTANAEAELIARDGTRHPRWFTSKRVDARRRPRPGRRRHRHQRAARRRGAHPDARRRFSDNIIESLPGVFYLFDDQGHFLRWNENFATVSQYSDDEIARMHPTEFFDGEGREHIAERIGQVFSDRPGRPPRRTSSPRTAAAPRTSSPATG